MPVKIRLMRIGAKKRPFYRIVAVDERKKRTGTYLELLGTYNPLTEPKEIILKQDKIDEWVKKGAVFSDGFLRIIKKAPQKPPRAPKKEKKEEPVSAGQSVSKSEDQNSDNAESADKAETADTAEVAEIADAAEVAETAETAEIADSADSADIAETEEAK